MVSLDCTDYDVLSYQSLSTVEAISCTFSERLVIGVVILSACIAVDIFKIICSYALFICRLVD